MSEVLLINPFHIAVEPMQQLLVVNFSKDYDDYYIGLELQVFKHTKTEESFVVVGWRRDGKVDVYFEVYSDVRGKDYNHMGKGLCENQKQHSVLRILRWILKALWRNFNLLISMEGKSA